LLFFAFFAQNLTCLLNRKNYVLIAPGRNGIIDTYRELSDKNNGGDWNEKEIAGQDV